MRILLTFLECFLCTMKRRSCYWSLAFEPGLLAKLRRSALFARMSNSLEDASGRYADFTRHCAYVVCVCVCVWLGTNADFMRHCAYFVRGCVLLGTIKVPPGMPNKHATRNTKSTPNHYPAYCPVPILRRWELLLYRTFHTWTGCKRPPTWNHNIKISGEKEKEIFLFKAKRTSNSPRLRTLSQIILVVYVKRMCMCVCVWCVVCVCVPHWKQPLTIPWL